MRGTGLEFEALALECGSTSLTRFASFDPESHSWKTSRTSGRAGSKSSSLTWPRSGIARGGCAFELPQLRALTSVTGGSVSRPLKTPTANLGSNGGARPPAERRAGGHGPTLDDEVCYLLPYSDAIREGREPEPAVDGPHSPAHWWGEYLPAIRQWEEVTGRAAPPPTEVGRKGGPRVTVEWVEWLMGLPLGHVTDVPGLTRGQQLQILGNGVVPQQASTAFRALLLEV